MKFILYTLLSFTFSQQVCYSDELEFGSNLVSFPILNESIEIFSDFTSYINNEFNCQAIIDSSYADSVVNYNSAAWITAPNECTFEICGIPSNPCITYNFNNPYESDLLENTYVYSFPVLSTPGGDIETNLSIFQEEGVGIYTITSQAEVSFYHPNLGWMGQINQIEYNTAYILAVSNPQSVEYCGYPYAYESMGDINQDGNIVIDDILWTLNHVIETEELNDYGQWAANLKFDYNIDLFDIIKMINLSLAAND